MVPRNSVVAFMRKKKATKKKQVALTHARYLVYSSGIDEISLVASQPETLAQGYCVPPRLFDGDQRGTLVAGSE